MRVMLRLSFQNYFSSVNCLLFFQPWRSSFSFCLISPHSLLILPSSFSAFYPLTWAFFLSFPPRLSSSIHFILLPSFSSQFPPLHDSSFIPPPPPVRQILFKKLSCSLMVKTLANRYLHTWQNACGGQHMGRVRQGWSEVRAKKGKNNKLTTRRPLFPQAEMDG